MSPSPVNVGDVLAGKYLVERVLGMGGMGVVVAAKHLSLGERVAIKFLLPQAMERADVVARFLREGQAAARLRSEHITRVHDVGKLESGAPFLVMEYLDGKDLSVVLRDKGPLAPEEAVDFVMQACEALAEAHAAGVIHRDLKPSNLFVIKRLDGSPSIKLIDFGISKVVVPGAEGAEGEMTATAVMMGSPLYMAPEQMASARDVDARADIWSLGIILHALLVGAPPFRAPTVMGVYEQIVEGAPPIRKQRADIPEGLEAAILKCLQKDRRARFADVGELAEAIAPFGPAEAVSAAQRIKRIIVARASSASLPPPPAEAPVPVVALTPATQPAPAKMDASAPPASGSSKPAEVTPPPGSGSLPASPTTDGPWDQRTRPPTSRRKQGAIAAVIAGVVVIGAPVAFFATRAPAGAGTSAPPQPTADIAVATAATATATAPQPSVSPAGAPPTAAPTVGVSASASASAAPSTQPSASARAPRSAAPPAAPKPAKPRSAEDLFGTQK